MGQLWKGRFKKELAKETNDFNSSISFDCRMFEEDIKGSMAHAAMLGAQGIIEKSESEKIISGLEDILNDIKSGKLEIDMNAEDIHTFVEGELTERLGQTGKSPMTLPLRARFASKGRTETRSGTSRIPAS